MAVNRRAHCPEPYLECTIETDPASTGGAVVMRWSINGATEAYYTYQTDPLYGPVSERVSLALVDGGGTGTISTVFDRYYTVTAKGCGCDKTCTKVIRCECTETTPPAPQVCAPCVEKDYQEDFQVENGIAVTVTGGGNPLPIDTNLGWSFTRFLCSAPAPVPISGTYFLPYTGSFLNCGAASDPIYTEGCAGLHPYYGPCSYRYKFGVGVNFNGYEVYIYLGTVAVVTIGSSGLELTNEGSPGTPQSAAWTFTRERLKRWVYTPGGTCQPQCNREYLVAKCGTPLTPALYYDHRVSRALNSWLIPSATVTNVSFF
jgi:hypothetical protein